jgi:3D-(3,5/4)-trihydroxycyclohexane-1,2-dione acylhydrolase (decyclizing)
MDLRIGVIGTGAIGKEHINRITNGYESWWRVGTEQVSTNPDVEKAAKAMSAEVARVRKF